MDNYIHTANFGGVDSPSAWRCSSSPGDLVKVAREAGATFSWRFFDTGCAVHTDSAYAPPIKQERLEGVLPGLLRRLIARSAEVAHAAGSS